MNHIERLTGSPPALLLVAAGLVVGLHGCSAPAPASMPAAARQEATYTTATGEKVCVTISTTATGPGAVPWAWATVNADPRRVLHVPASELQAGCRP